MIQPMKKIILLCLEQDRKVTLDRLSDLSVMHISVLRGAENSDTARLKKRLSDLQKCMTVLSESCDPDAPECFPDAESVLDQFNRLQEEKNSLLKEREVLKRQYEELMPWGDFSFRDLQALESKGIFSMFAILQKGEIPELPEGVTRNVVCHTGSLEYSVFFAFAPVKIEGIVPVVLPEKTLPELKTSIETVGKRLAAIEQTVSAMKPALPKLKSLFEQTENKLDFALAACSMTEHGGRIIHLGGYVPEIFVEKLRSAAAKNGWALSISDPEPDDDQVPTFITKPKWLDIMDPLFDFIGVAPGYRENDVNLFFLIFFPIFFGMIIGDAVYGMIFFISSVTGKIIFRKRESARLPLNLFLLLSCFSITWGWLNGAWAGLPANILPGWMQGLDFFSAPDKSHFACAIARRVGILPEDVSPDIRYFDAAAWGGKIVQWICFFLAALHLCSARIFKFVTEFRSNWRAYGHLGWALLLAANFFMAVNLIVFPGTFPVCGWWMYGIGTVLVVVTITFEDSLNLPFALIGSFTDVLSYIRLYAVGMAGTLIAVKFNEMGLMVTRGKQGVVLMFAVAALVLIALFGHLLNIALNFLSVLVHAIRLNTLEFSNHMGMQWAGILYKPFKKTNSEKSQK